MKNLFSVVTFILFFGFFSPAALAGPFFEFEEDLSLPLVHINLVIDIGASQDPTAKLGLANVASRMLLRGTNKHSKAEINALLDQYGAMIEPTVQSEGTIFRMLVLEENLDKFLKLAHEIFTQPQFLGVELDKVKKEVEGELLEQKGSDAALVGLHHLRFFYGQHPYGNPVLGTQKGVQRLILKDVVDYYSTSFGDPRVSLFASGATKKDTLETWFKNLRKEINAKNPKVKDVVETPKPSEIEGLKILLVNKPGATQSHVYIGGSGMRPERRGHYAVELANYSFGGHSFNARMMQELRVKRGWTYGAYSSFRYGRQPKHYSMYFYPKTQDTIPALKLGLQMLKDFAEKGLTNDEFEFAKKSITNNSPFNYDTAKKRLENTTQEFLLQFPKDYFKDYASKIDAVKFEEIRDAVNGIIKPKDIRITVLGDAEKLKQELKKLGGVTIKGYLEE